MANSNQLEKAKNFFLLGLECFQKNLYQDAKNNFLQSLNILPDRLSTITNLVVVLLKLQELEEATLYLSKGLNLYPNDGSLLFNQGLLFLIKKRYSLSVLCFDRSIKEKPDSAKSFFYRGISLQNLKCLDDALSNFNKAIDLKPDYAEAFNNRGIVLAELKCFDKAIESYEKAIEFNPNFAEAFLNIGNLFQKKRFLNDSLLMYDKAIELKFGYAEAFNNRGVVLVELKNFDMALLSYDKSIELNPDYADAHWNKSLCLLLLGDLRNGFLEYEWRRKIELDIKSTTLNKYLFSQMLWLGDASLANKTILLWSEQGLGDTIQFCRYCKLVKGLGARVILEVPKSLIALLESLEGVDILIEKGKPIPGFDYQCPLLSLPLAFQTTIETIPSSIYYLKSKNSLLTYWKRYIGGKSMPLIGLVWSGSASHLNDSNRSLSLADVIKYLPAGFKYISLQKEVRECDIDILVNSKIMHFGELINDFADTAALCDLMDIVISVDTSVAHLAGALGKRTYVLLPYVPDWRWLLDRVDSPWYQSMKLYRQGADRQYSSVFERLASDLTKALV